MRADGVPGMVVYPGWHGVGSTQGGMVWSIMAWSIMAWSTMAWSIMAWSIMAWSIAWARSLGLG